MSKKMVTNAIFAALLAAVATEGAMAVKGTATARPPTVSEIAPPAALGATVGATAAMSASQAATVVSLASKGKVVSQSTRTKLEQGLQSKDLNEVVAAQKLLGMLQSADKSAQSQALAAMTQNGSLSGAVAAMTVIGNVQQAAAPKAPAGESCGDSIPAAASKVLEGFKGEGCSLTAAGKQNAIQIATEVAADGVDQKDAGQFRDSIQKRNGFGVDQANEGMRTLDSKCLIFAKHLSERIKAGNY